MPTGRQPPADQAIQHRLLVASAHLPGANNIAGMPATIVVTGGDTKMAMKEGTWASLRPAVQHAFMFTISDTNIPIPGVALQ